jgi:hypothetical protein
VVAREGLGIVGDAGMPVDRPETFAAAFITAAAALTEARRGRRTLPERGRHGRQAVLHSLPDRRDAIAGAQLP